ncbi:hypothetical protein [Pseudomonas tohonis]|uniref:hypothetical protein n=1 Tax=Pseudomonas tohonis TaxID=2725477 RepID=UPI0021D8EC34|nr:hypothetical protein [Pseudomonas tohonis]UXY51316.1 hypothetical protein N9L84_20425 [Pseudomonas tohonis]
MSLIQVGNEPVSKENGRRKRAETSAASINQKQLNEFDANFAYLEQWLAAPNNSGPSAIKSLG